MVQTLFMEAMKAALKSEKVSWQRSVTTEQWEALFDLARIHRVLPMVFDAVSACPAAQTDSALFQKTKREVYRLILAQVSKTAAFTELYRGLAEEGLRPVLVKGLVCRSLYPNPDFRDSGDEDLLIGPGQFAACHEAMLRRGMVVSNPHADLQKEYEVPYRKPESPLYIELHRYLFPPEAEAYGAWNDLFDPEQMKTVIFTANAVQMRTPEPGTHMLYLICHAYKHFIHSGFGIRQLCDIGLFARAYSREIDWSWLCDRCRTIRAERFAAAIFKIARVHLDIPLDTESWPELWRAMAVDERALLEDLLCAGIYGQSSQSRRHSSNMTLDAVADGKKGSSGGPGLRNSLFPGRSRLEGRYPYLKKYPVLLPLAWTSRVVSYLRESAREQDSAVEALKIGRERIQLLKQYGIID